MLQLETYSIYRKAKISRIRITYLDYFRKNIVQKKKVRGTIIGIASYCWRAIARQHTILYNRAKSAKFVGCKIGDMRSRFRF